MLKDVALASYPRAIAERPKPVEFVSMPYPFGLDGEF